MSISWVVIAFVAGVVFVVALNRSGRYVPGQPTLTEQVAAIVSPKKTETEKLKELLNGIAQTTR